uniref:Uncharacterized protein n=1 Tax=Arundo donax TaxID=35708 RepID=A0A0A8YHI8_ARUDO
MPGCPVPFFPQNAARGPPYQYHTGLTFSYPPSIHACCCCRCKLVASVNNNRSIINRRSTSLTLQVN